MSGGPDSLALLLLAAATRPQGLCVLTVDHGLRPESAGEARMVAGVAERLGLPHHVLRPVEAIGPANLQAAARELRYGLMGDWCAAHRVPFLATAHHAQDQAETLLLRLARGAGLSGLAGIRARRPLGGGVTLVRPLLGAMKSELAAIVEAAGLMPADDPSNRSLAFDRTAARALLSVTPWLRAERVAASAAHLAEAADALSWAEERAWAGRAVRLPEGGLEVDAEDLPRALRFALLARALGSAESPPDGPELARLLDSLGRGEAGTLGGMRAFPGPPWRFVPERRVGGGG